MKIKINRFVTFDHVTKLMCKYPPSLFMIVLIMSFLLGLLWVNITEARPEFAAELDKDCTFCHIDPAGGGPRSPLRRGAPARSGSTGRRSCGRRSGSRTPRSPGGRRR